MLYRQLRIPQYISIYFILVIPFIFIATFAAIESYSVGGIAFLLLKPVRILVTLLGGLGLVAWAYRLHGDKALYLILNCIFISIFLHALIMIAQFIYPDFKDWVYSIVTTGEHRSSFGYNFRMGGLSGGTGGSVLSVVQSLGVVLYPFLAKYFSRWRLVYLCGALVCAFSVALCGRSGFICIAIFLPVSLVAVGGRLNEIFKALSVLLSFGLVVFAVFTISGFEPTFELTKTLQRSFSFFVEFGDKGIAGDDTVKYLSTGVFLPDSVHTFLLGDPEALLNTQFERTLQSDVGYIRNLFGFGLFGSFLYWFPLILTMANAFRNRSAHQIYYMLGMCCLIMMFFHLKEPVIYVRMFFPIICLLMGCAYIHNNPIMLADKRS